MLPNKSANSGAIKGAEVGEASFSSPPCLLDEEEYEAGPIFRDNELQALCLAPLPRWSGWKRGPGRPALRGTSQLRQTAAPAFPNVAGFVVCSRFFLRRCLASTSNNL